VGVETLHITNGDSVLYLWKKAGLLGTQLAWRDILHEGPVPSGLSLEELSRIRTQFLAQNGYGNAIKIGRDFEKRDATIRRAREFDEVVLWFEHDLFDQLHVIQILSMLKEMDLHAGAVQLIQTDQYLGTLSAEELMALMPKRRSVTAAMLASADRVWRAFIASSATLLQAAAAERYVGLPFLHDALLRLCEEFPAMESGVSRTEKQLVEAAAKGARRQEDLFRRSQAGEEAGFLSDKVCYAVIGRLCAPPEPLLALLEDGYDATVLGRRVLGGDADWLAYQPLDRWIGGIHLTREHHWRWNDETNHLVERAS